MASYSLERVWLDDDELNIEWASLDHGRNEYGLGSWSVEVQLDGFPSNVDVLNLGQAAFRGEATDGTELLGQVIQQNVSGGSSPRLSLLGTGPLAGVD